MKPYPVEITWVDSTFLHGWKRPGDFRTLEPDLCTSIGYLVARTDEAVTIVQSISDDQHADGITIPRCTIRRIRRLR